jgi:hypothetical protein
MADAVWKPLKFKPLDSVAAVRLQFVQLFPSDAKSWNFDEQHPQQGKYKKQKLRNTTLLSMLCKLEEELDISLDDGGPRDADVTRLRSNNYGVRAKDGGGSRVVGLALKLFDRTFKPVVGQRATAVTSQMANAAVGANNDSNFENLNEFRERYEGMIDPLRSQKELSIDVLAIIAHYDDWIVYLTDRVSDSKESDKLAGTNDLPSVVGIALESSRALRKLLDGQPGSAFLDLYRFQRLTNELQTHCAAVGLDAEKNLSGLKAEIEKAGYFKQLDRYLEITEYTRIDEAMHGLAVATTISNKKLMKRYGLLMVKAMQRVLVKIAKVTPTPNHPVMRLEMPLFEGELPPVEISQLKSYLKDVHPAVIEEIFSKN